MLYAAIVLFALAAILGLLIFKNWVTSAQTSKTVVYAHGLFAAIALVILIVFYLQNNVKPLQLSIILFVIAALGGFYMFFRDLKGKFSPTWLAAIHGVLAIAGFAVLIFYLV